MQCIALRAFFILAEWCSLRVILESILIPSHIVACWLGGEFRGGEVEKRKKSNVFCGSTQGFLLRAVPKLHTPHPSTPRDRCVPFQAMATFSVASSSISTAVDLSLREALSGIAGSISLVSWIVLLVRTR